MMSITNDRLEILNVIVSDVLATLPDNIMEEIKHSAKELEVWGDLNEDDLNYILDIIGQNIAWTEDF